MMNYFFTVLLILLFLSMHWDSHESINILIYLRLQRSVNLPDYCIAKSSLPLFLILQSEGYKGEFATVNLLSISVSFWKTWILGNLVTFDYF